MPRVAGSCIQFTRRRRRKVATARSKEEEMIDAGRAAPDFTLANQDGEPVSLSSLRGRWVALYFYPKADTPGCTKQACGIRDHSADYEAANTVVLGISPDSVDELRAFADKYGLAFTLLSDDGHQVADTYGVWDELQFGDLKVWGNRRSSVLIDPDGEIVRVFPDVKPDEHDDLLLGALAEFGALARG
jgi:thioredoxin-dependent peroxiredoxin